MQFLLDTVVHVVIAAVAVLALVLFYWGVKFNTIEFRVYSL